MLMPNYTLAEILEYRNDDVISSFLDSYNVTEEQAIDIFTEMLRFIWFCNIPGNKEFATVDHPLTIIDEMWHQFILTTKDYISFCNNFFGEYIHHAPATKIEKTKFSEEKKDIDFRDRFLNEKRRKYEYVYDMLGEDIFIKWYEQYPTIYSLNIIKSIRK